MEPTVTEVNKAWILLWKGKEKEGELLFVLFWSLVSLKATTCLLWGLAWPALHCLRVSSRPGQERDKDSKYYGCLGEIWREKSHVLSSLGGNWKDVEGRARSYGQFCMNLTWERIRDGKQQWECGIFSPLLAFLGHSQSKRWREQEVQKKIKWFKERIGDKMSCQH